MKKKETIAELSLILVALIWGSGFIATEYVIKADWNTTLIMATRFIIASVAMAIALNKKILKITKYELLHGSFAGVLLFFAFYLQTFGQSATTVSNAAFITATNVVMVPFISWGINRNRPNIQTILLTLMTLAGVGVLSFKDSGFSLGRGDLIVLVCAFFFAMQITYLEKATKGSDPARVNFVQILSATVISVIVFIVKGEGLQGANIQQGILPVIFLGLFSTCLCYFLQTSAQKYSTASKVGVILSLEGLFGGLFSVLLGLEPLTINLVIGGILIIGATILMSIDFKSLRKKVNKSYG
jgi:drug/metabolite transporter (DMT)-like permease